MLPAAVVARDEKGQETRLVLKGGGANGVIDAQTGQSRQFAFSLGGARVDDQKTGGWISFGPLSMSSKLTLETGGGWTGPMDFELKGIEFFFTEGPVGGAIGRVTYAARSNGPDLAALNRLRSRLEKVQQDEHAPPADRLNALLEVLPELPALFSEAKGEMSVQQVTVRASTGEPFVAFDKASVGGSLTGLSGDAAALRITLQQDGLNLAPSVLDKDKVPRRVVLDFGLEEVDSKILLSILQTAAKLRLGGSDAEHQRVQQQLIGAAAQLNPVLRIYDLVVDTPAVGVDAKAQARGSPLSPKGYKADANVTVRGFDAVRELMPKAPLVAFLPLLKEIGTVSTGTGGATTVVFHLASAPPKWLTLNGQDISTWFTPAGRGSEGRKLRPAEPPMTGNDVRAVQQALADASMAAPQTGTYDAATPVAVARYQKQQGLNIDGVVDAELRRRLGVKVEPAAPAPRPRAN